METTDVGAAGIGAAQVDLGPDGNGPARESGGPPGDSPEWAYAFVTHCAAETKRIAEAIGGFARDGWVVLLSGPLGAGKTTFAQGLFARLGVGGPVRSPTFTIINEYPGILTCWHVDLYRLGGGEDFAAIGGDEILLGGEGLVVVEWAERLCAGGSLPSEYVWVDLEFLAPGTPDDRRLVTVSLKGGGYRAASAGLAGLDLPAASNRRDGP